MIKRNTTLLILVIVLLQGCVGNGYWHKIGSTQEEFAKAKYICLKESQQPESNKLFASKSSISESRETDAFMSGFLSGFHKNETSMVTNDALFSACMNAYGYYWRNEK